MAHFPQFGRAGAGCGRYQVDRLGRDLVRLELGDLVTVQRKQLGLRRRLRGQRGVHRRRGLRRRDLHRRQLHHRPWLFWLFHHLLRHCCWLLILLLRRITTGRGLARPGGQQADLRSNTVQHDLEPIGLEQHEAARAPATPGRRRQGGQDVGLHGATVSQAKQR